MITHPIGVYINWASYDELSDNVELTESLAIQQLDEMIRLRSQGVRLDYYMMDAFWYASDGGYRTWRKPHWPAGPDRWLDKCLAHGIKPGLWVSTNTLCKLQPVPAWESSLNAGRTAMCFFHGGYLAHFMESLHLWYERGVRMYKFDFSDLMAAPASLEATMLPSEIRDMNIRTFRAALKAFRASHPQVAFIGYNGLEEYPSMHAGRYFLQGGTSLPFRKVIDPAWLESFDSLYCGDPRTADVPCSKFWRSKDIYSDHMVRMYELSGFPLKGIDNAGFMVGATGTCYFRKTAAWQGMLLLSLARGGWVNTYYGNLDLIDEPKARWFAKVQSMFFPLQSHGEVRTFGSLPGTAKPYGFTGSDPSGALFTVVNPSQAIATIDLPLDTLEPGAARGARVLFADAGFKVGLTNRTVTLGPEQAALIGVGRFAAAEYDLGLQDDVVIPLAIKPLDAVFSADGPKSVISTISAPASGTIRVVFQQRDKHGIARRTSGGSPPGGTPLGRLLVITATQNGQSVPVKIEYDKAIWSGLSWAVGEIEAKGSPIIVRFTTSESDVELTGEAFVVS